MPSRQLVTRHLFVTLSFVLLHFILNQPQVIFFSRMGFVAWYPAIGIVIALLVGVSPWYGIVACFADVLTSIFIYGQTSPTFSNTACPAGVAACYAGAAYVLRGPLRIDLGLRRRRDVVSYVLVGTIAAALATVIGVTSLRADHSITWAESFASARSWFLGDALSLVGVAPFLLVHILPYLRKWLSTRSAQADDPPSPATELTATTVAEICGQALTILAVVWVIFGAQLHLHLYLCFIPIVWIAMRQGVRRVVTGTLALNCACVIAMRLSSSETSMVTSVALLMLVLSSVGLIVGSEVSERQRLAMDLDTQSTYVDSLIQNSPLGIVVLDRQGHVELANPAFEKLLQYDRNELASLDIERFIPGVEEGLDSRRLIPYIFAGNTLHRTVRQRRKDGQLLELALHAVPLLLKDEVRGAYLIFEDITEQIRANEAQREHAESLDRTVKELELRTREMTSLNEMMSLLECAGTVKEACAVAANSVEKLFPESSSGGVFLFKSSRNMLQVAARWGDDPVSEANFTPEACWSLRLGSPYWSEQPGHGVSCQHLGESSNKLGLCVPMVAQGNTVGVLHLDFESMLFQKEASSKEARQRLAVSAASQIGLALASLQLRETLREQSIRDPLTHLFNRRFLEECLDRELQQAIRKKQPIAVLFLDLDHFKKFNDTFGHEAGDLVLKSLADLFRKFFRGTDICCRYGGEEFAVVLPESSARDAGLRTDELRASVKNLRLEYKNQMLGPLTLSAGVAAFPDHASTSVGLLKIADQCLYESKAKGRNRVTVAPADPFAQDAAAKPVEEAKAAAASASSADGRPPESRWIPEPPDSFLSVVSRTVEKLIPE